MPSYYEALPIYKIAMDVAVRVDAIVQRFAKGHKYTLGARLRDTTLDVVMLIARSNRRAERARHISLLCDRIEDLKLMLNLGKEVKAFSSLKQSAGDGAGGDARGPGALRQRQVAAPGLCLRAAPGY